MWQGLNVFVVVPAYNEAPRIGRTLGEIPAWVDAIVVVDDASRDQTGEAARASDRAIVLRHEANRGVGAAIVTGYRHALTLANAKEGPSVFAVMAGDGQMDPADLPHLLAPLAAGECDYAKGNRFAHPDVRRNMPPGRYVGGRVFSTLTSIATGVSIRDSQCGYTAITREACEALDLAGLWQGFGYPNDLVSQLALRGLRIVEVPVVPRYGDEESKLRLRHLPRIGWLIARAALRRAQSF